MEQVDPSELTGPPSHNFALYADGATYRAVQGSDFDGSPEGYRSALRRWCERNGYALTAKRDTRSVTFRITRPPA